MSAYLVEVEDRIPVGSHPQPKAPDRQAENVNEQQLHASTLAEAFSEEYRLPGMVKENTTWDVYNNEARKVDHELVKDWTASLNFLLLFVSPLITNTISFLISDRRPFSPRYSPRSLSRARSCWRKIPQMFWWTS